MGIALPSAIADPILGRDLGMEQLEIRELCRRIQAELRTRLPDDRAAFRISRQDSLSAVIAKVNEHGRTAGDVVAPPIVSLNEVPKDTRRGGTVQILLSPKTVGSVSGFMGAVTLAPGNKVKEHYHPYSEEFVYVVSGRLLASLDGTRQQLQARQAMLIPKGVRHQLINEANEEAFLVIHLSPLAPRPELGHVDTE
jgi:putative monooxygenase